MAKIKRNPDGSIGLGKNKPWSARQKSAKSAEEKSERQNKAEAVRKSASSKAKRYSASKYVKFDSAGNFAGYKPGKPKGYVYLGGRYLTNTNNMSLVSKYSSKEQKDFVRKNRKAVMEAVEAASRKGAFKKDRFGNFADFDLASAGPKFKGILEKAFGTHSQMHTRRTRDGYGHAGMRSRKQWSFAFGQDGHVK